MAIFERCKYPHTGINHPDFSLASRSLELGSYSTKNQTDKGSDDFLETPRSAHPLHQIVVIAQPSSQSDCCEVRAGEMASKAGMP
jgi:hypothetical protein